MKNKKIHLEVIRIIALICIIYNHTGERGNTVYQFTNGIITFWFSLIADILCKIGVPLFLMITGALLFEKEESWQQVYSKRVWRIIKVIILVTIIRYLYECFVVNTYIFSVTQLVRVILTGELFVPYWFLYAYLSILLVLPFLRKMIQNMDVKEMHLMTTLILFFTTILPFVSTMLQWKFELSFMLGTVCCYCILGYYLENVLALYIDKKKKIAIAGLLLLSCVALTCWMVVKDRSITGVVADWNSGILVIPIAISIYVLVKEIFEKRAMQRWLQNLILQIGSCAFGIYLIEDYLRNGLAFIFDLFAPYITTLPACVIWLIAVVIVGIVIISIMKKIPLLKDIL